MPEDVTNYGAVGDGTTDDTQAIRNAADAAAPNGVVYFPSGTYLVGSSDNSPFRYPTDGSWDNLTWEGESYSNTKILMDSGQSQTYFGFHIDLNGSGQGTVTGATFKNLHFDGDGKNQNYDIGLCVKAEESSVTGDLTFRNCIIDDWGTNGVEIESGSADVRYCKFVDNGDGTYQYNNGSSAGHDWVTDQNAGPSSNPVYISDTVFEHTQGAVIDTAGGNTVVENCVMYSTGVGGKEFAAGVKQNVGTESVVVRNTHIHSMNRMGWKEDQGETGDAGTIELDNVIIEDCGRPAVDMPVQTTLTGNTVKIDNVDENVLRGPNGAGIFINPNNTSSGTANIDSLTDVSIHNVGPNDDGDALQLTNVTGSINNLTYAGASLGSTASVSVDATQSSTQQSPTVPTTSEIGPGSDTSQLVSNLQDYSAFSQTLHAVNDLGLDPNGGTICDTDVENALTDGTLIEFPDGEFLFRDMWVTNKQNVGLTNVDGANPTIKTPTLSQVEEETCIVLDGDGLLLEGFTFDYRGRGDDGGPTVQVQTDSGDLYVNDLTYKGYYFDKALLVSVGGASGQGLVENIDARDGSKDNTSTVGMLVNQSRHDGSITIRNSSFYHCTSGGIYASPNSVSGDMGPVTIEDCTFKNNNTANVRLGGTGSSIDGCTFIQNGDLQGPNVTWNNSNPQRDGSIHAPRQIQLRDGGVAGDDISVSNCTFTSTDPKIETLGADIHLRGDYSGSLSLSNCDIRHDHSDSIVIDGSNTHGPVKIDNCNLTGSGCANVNGAVVIYDRDGSTFTNSCLYMTNADTGIYYSNLSNYQISDSSITVANTQIRTPNSTGTTSNISTGNDCTTNSPPVADAGTDFQTDEGLVTELDGTSSSDPDGDTLSYSWIQTTGPSVSLTDQNTATPEFTAPEVSSDETLTFQLTVTDSNGLSDSDTVTVTVKDVPASQTSYFVDPVNGSDSNAGTSLSNAFQTLTPLDNTLLDAGDVVYVRDNGTVTQTTTVSLQEIRGKATEKIQIRPYQNESPVIDFAGSNINGFDLSGSSYIVLDGLEIKNVGRTGVYIADTSSYDAVSCQIQNCNIHDYSTSSSQRFGIQIFGASDDHTIRNNDIHHGRGGDGCDSIDITGQEPVTNTDTLIEGIQYDEVVYANADLGWDNTGSNQITGTQLSNDIQQGRAIIMETGTYEFATSCDKTSLPRKCALLGGGSSRNDVTLKAPDGQTIQRMFVFNNNTDHVFKDFVADRQDRYDCTFGLFGGNAADYAGKTVIKNVEYLGWTPDGAQMLTWAGQDPNSELIVDGFLRTGPTRYEHYPYSIIDILVTVKHQGSAEFRNVEIHNGSESGIYTGKHQGDVLIEDCHMYNVVHSAYRIAGDTSVLRNSSVEFDYDNQDPDNQVVDSTYDEYNDPAEPQLNRPIWIQSGAEQRAGPLIEDVDVKITSGAPSYGIAGIYQNSDTGGATIRNCRISCYDDNFVPIWGENYDSSNAGGTAAMTVEDTHIYSQAQNTVIKDYNRSGLEIPQGMLTLYQRDGSVVRNCVFESPSGYDGVSLYESENVTIEDCDFNTSGSAWVQHDESSGLTTTNNNTNSSVTATLPSMLDPKPSEYVTKSFNDGSTGGWPTNILVTENELHHNDDNGLTLATEGDDCEISYNRIHNNGIAGDTATGIGIVTGSSTTGTGHLFHHNLIAYNETDAVYAVNAVKDHRFYNNTFYSNGRNGIQFPTDSAANVVARNNLSQANSSSAATNLFNVDSGFNSWDLNISGTFESTTVTDDNFLHQTSGSATVDAGVDVGLPFSGTSPDVGGHELGQETVGTGQFTATTGFKLPTSITADSGRITAISSSPTPLTNVNESVPPITVGADTYQEVRRTIYVDPVNGSNSNTGESPNQAFADFTEVGVIDSGDELYILNDVSTTQTLEVRNAQGTSTKPIRVEGIGDVTIDFAGNGDSGIVIDDSEHVQVSNLTLTNADAHGVEITNSERVVLNDCEIHGFGVSTLGNGVSASNSDVTVTHTDVYNGQDPESSGLSLLSDTDVVLKSVTSRDNPDAGIVCNSTTTIEAIGCTTYNNAVGIDAPRATVEIRRCIADSNTNSGFNLTNADGEIQNCTSLGNTTGYVMNSQLVVQNNISYNETATDGTGNEANNTWNVGISDPQFVSTTYGDDKYLWIQSSSPCIDAGLLNGNTYAGQKPDIGTAEYTTDETFYVNGQTGSDNDIGRSTSSAFETFDVLEHELTIGDGVEIIVQDDVSQDTPVVLDTWIGTNANNVTIKSDGVDRNVEFTAQTYGTGFSIRNCEYVNVTDLIVQSTVNDGIECDSQCSNVTIKDCTAQNIGRDTFFGHGIHFNGSSNCTANNVAVSGTVEAGIYLDASTSTTVLNCNTSVAGTNGVEVDGATSYLIDKTQTFFNTEGVYAPNGSGTIQRTAAYFNDNTGINVTSSTQSTVYNVTVYRNDVGLVSQNAAHEIANAIAYDNETSEKTIGTTTNVSSNTWNKAITEPLFASESFGQDDFLHLSKDSPCVDEGVDVGLTFNGIAPDLGAFESPHSVGDDSGPTLPVSTGLIVHLKASTNVTTSSGNVTRWDDETGLINAEPGDGSTAPAYVENYRNGRPAIHFNGTSDGLLDGNSTPLYNRTTRSTLPEGADTRTLFMVAEFSGTGGGAGVFTGRYAADKSIGLGIDTSGNVGWDNYPNFTNPSTTTGTDGVMVLTFTYDGSAWELRKNGSVIDSGTYTLDTVFEELALGRDYFDADVSGDGSLNYTEMWLTEYLQYNQLLTSQEIADVEQYLNAKYLDPTVSTSPFNAVTDVQTPYEQPVETPDSLVSVTDTTTAYTNVLEPIQPFDSQSSVTETTANVAPIVQTIDSESEWVPPYYVQVIPVQPFTASADIQTAETQNVLAITDASEALSSFTVGSSDLTVPISTSTDVQSLTPRTTASVSTSFPRSDELVSWHNTLDVPVTLELYGSHDEDFTDKELIEQTTVSSQTTGYETTVLPYDWFHVTVTPQSSPSVGKFSVFHDMQFGVVDSHGTVQDAQTGTVTVLAEDVETTATVYNDVADLQVLADNILADSEMVGPSGRIYTAVKPVDSGVQLLTPTEILDVFSDTVDAQSSLQVQDVTVYEFESPFTTTSSMMQSIGSPKPLASEVPVTSDVKDILVSNVSPHSFDIQTGTSVDTTATAQVTESVQPIDCTVETPDIQSTDEMAKTVFLEASLTPDVDLVSNIGDTVEKNQDFENVQGDTRYINFPVYDDEDNREDLTNVEKITYALSEYPDTETIIEKTYDETQNPAENGVEIIDVTDGYVRVSLDPADTESLEGEYYHEVEFIKQNGEVSTGFTGNPFFTESNT